MRFSDLTIAVASAALLAAGASFAADLEIPPRTAPEDVSVHKGPPNCSRWTDECVNCSRGAEGDAPVCSNIGFACQPKAVRCLSPAVPHSEPQKNNCERRRQDVAANTLPLPLFHAALRKRAQFLAANCFPSKPQRDTT